jgi:hypothetical protein
LKGRKRTEEKAHDDYSERKPGPAVSWLYDIVRGSIEFSSSEQLLKCIELMKKDKSILIVKAKNRFEHPSLSGYRDLNILIQIDTSQGFKHICVVEMHHKAIKKLDKKLKSHVYYEYFRSYFAGATGSLKERLDDLKLISDGAAVGGSF